MGKSSHFIGQPMYSQVIKLLDKSRILQISRENGGERYTKRFNGWIHLVVMLYAIIMRFDSLREITASLLTEARKLSHIGITFKIDRGTLADANKRRPEAIFESIYRDTYATYRHVLSSDSRTGKTPQWMRRLQIIDSTTITLFSNLIFKGVGRHPKNGKKKGGIKVHTVIHANEGVPSDIRFTSAATNDSFMLKPSSLSKGDIIAMDRAYIDYEKFEQLTEKQVIYVTKMKKSLKYEILGDTIYQTPEGVMEVRVQEIRFTKKKQGGETIVHNARIITYVDVRKHKLISLLTNDMEFDPSEINDGGNPCQMVRGTTRIEQRGADEHRNQSNHPILVLQTTEKSPFIRAFFVPLHHNEKTVTEKRVRTFLDFRIICLPLRLLTEG